MNYIDAINEMDTGTILIVNSTKYRLAHEMIQAELNTGWVNTNLSHLKLSKLNFEFIPTSLSDKLAGICGTFYDEKYVKQFINDIKRYVGDGFIHTPREVCIEIDNLAGDRFKD